MRQLYRVLGPSAHVLLSILCRVGSFHIFYRFYACAGCSMSRAYFCKGLVPDDDCKSSLSITDAVGSPQVVLK